MRAWVMGMSLVLLAKLVWADGASNNWSGMEGERWLVTASEASGIEGQVTIRPMRRVQRRPSGGAAVCPDASLTRVELEADDLRVPIVAPVFLVLCRVLERAVIRRIEGQGAIVAPARKPLLRALAGCVSHTLLGREL